VDALLEVREEGCRGGGRCEAETAWHTEESALALRLEVRTGLALSHH
jgi:hypothetical protein